MYFIAIAAPQAVNEQVLNWKHYMRDHYGCTVALRSPAHITLIPPFWMPELLEMELVSDVNIFSVLQSPFSISPQNFDAFKPKVIFVGVEKSDALLQLKLSLEGYLLSLHKYPVKKETRPFHPHLTIANRDLRKKDFAPAYAHFNSISYRESFPANGLSLLKHDGNEWIIRHTWPFSSIR